LAIVSASIYASKLLICLLLHRADDVAWFLIREVLDFLICLFASWIVGRLEGRTIADYGLPWHKTFRVQFWRGAMIGFALLTPLLLTMRLCGVFSFGTITLRGADIWKWATVYALVFILVLCGKNSVLGDMRSSRSRPVSVSGLLNAGLFGLLACFLQRRTGNLWMPIGVHMAFDWGETYFFGVADSGQVLPGHFLSPRSFGRAWLSGR
jgi:membrane protease YdiL (CAAX protease family)